MGIHTDNRLRNRQAFSEIPDAVAISFTSNAIEYLPSVTMPIDLDEWVWHEEIVNGRKLCIVTDKIISTIIVTEQ